jgi:hypothetical protein
VFVYTSVDKRESVELMEVEVVFAIGWGLMLLLKSDILILATSPKVPVWSPGDRFAVGKAGRRDRRPPFGFELGPRPQGDPREIRLHVDPPSFFDE